MARKFVLGPNAARKFSELIRGSGEVSRRAGAVSGLAFESEYAAPYTIQWAQSAGSGSGSWIIWLPSSELVVTPDGSLNPAQSLTAAGGEYPAGWYLLADSMLSSSSGGTLYLNITLGDDPEAEFSNTPSSSSSGSGSEDDEDKFSIPICNATVSSDGERKIKQFATSVITVGGSGDGGLSGEVDFIGALLYNKDTSTQQEIGSDTVDFALYARTDTLDLATGAVNQGAWSKVFDTIPHENIYN